MTTTALPSKLATCSAQMALDKSFAAIDWQAPWLCHLSQLDYLTNHVRKLSEPLDNLDEVAKDNAINDGISDVKNNSISSNFSTTVIAELLNTAMNKQSSEWQTQPPQTKPSKVHQAHSLEFVAQDALPEGMGYEQFIATTGKIPTRDNLHDLFNGSIWLTFPKTKALLNYHHMLQIAKRTDAQGEKEYRGRVRDTITVFDENGAVLVTCEPSIGEALVNFDWQASLITPRAHFDNPHQVKYDAQAAVYIFGHALLEQLIQPRKALCAHSVIINVTAAFFTLTLPERMRFLDTQLAEHMHMLLSQANITPRQLAPLPILGVPHFWADNVNSSFYADAYVFRNGRRQ